MGCQHWEPIGKPMLGHEDGVWSVAFSPPSESLQSSPNLKKDLRSGGVSSNIPILTLLRYYEIVVGDKEVSSAAPVATSKAT